MSALESPSSVSLPPIPDGWVPNDSVIVAIARRDDADRWSVILPQFTIVGLGDDLDDAVREAQEMLEDYLRICVRDGRSYAEARRPISRGWYLKLLAGVGAATIAHRIRHRAQKLRRLRLPAPHALCS